MKLSPTAALALGAALYVGACATPKNPIEEHADLAQQEASLVEEFSYVQNAGSGSYDGKRLTLVGTAPTIYFSDRPYRVFGHMQGEEFLANWTVGPDSFADDPPNAILSLLSADQVQSWLVELRSPKFRDGTLSYEIDVADDTLPANFGACSLFIAN